MNRSKKLRKAIYLSGVTTVKVHLDSGTVHVEFNPSEISLDKIKEIIDDQGYDVQ